MMLYEALVYLQDKIVVDASNPDGNVLMRQIKSYYVKKNTSVTNKQTLLKEFNSIKRETNWSFSAFTTRYQKKILELELNEVTTTKDDQTRAYGFLIALNSKVKRKNICLEINLKARLV